MREVRSSEPAFIVRMEAAQEPGRYRVFIRPAATTKPAQVPIRLSATVGGHPKVHVIFAAVK